jgi:salicylate 5-hydroxylase small subunit
MQRSAATKMTCNVARCIDKVTQKDGSLKFRSRLCMYDSEMILNSLIYPV